QAQRRRDLRRLAAPRCSRAALDLGEIGDRAPHRGAELPEGEAELEASGADSCAKAEGRGLFRHAFNGARRFGRGGAALRSACFARAGWRSKPTTNPAIAAPAS